MKKNFLLILFAMCLASPTWAQTSFTDSSTGLTFNIVDEDAKTVEVGSNLTFSGALSIPDQVVYEEETYTVVGVGEKAFYDSANAHASVTTVEMSDNITYISAHAFHYNTTITSVQLGKNIEKIGEYAFDMCSGWTGTLVIPDGVTTIEQYTFDGCKGLTSLNLNNVVTINDYAFNNCTGLTNLVIPNSVVTIGNYSFNNYDSTSLTIGSSVEKIGNSAFDDTDYLTSITTLNPTPPTIGSSEFDWGSATVHVPAGTLEEYRSVWGTSGGTHFGISAYDELSYTVLKITLDNDENGYATYYNGSYDTTLPEGIKAYWAESVEGGAVTLTEIEEVIPAKTAVVLAGALTNYAQASVTSSSTESEYTDNLLHSQSTTAEISAQDGYYYYMLTTDTSGNNLGFYWGANDGGAFSSKANKAWLAVPQTSGTSALSIKFKDKDDETTGISSIEVDGEGNSLNNGAIYTIQGVRVSNMNQKGIYIVDGKKVLVK